MPVWEEVLSMCKAGLKGANIYRSYDSECAGMVHVRDAEILEAVGLDENERKEDFDADGRITTYGVERKTIFKARQRP